MQKYHPFLFFLLTKFFYDVMSVRSLEEGYPIPGSAFSDPFSFLPESHPFLLSLKGRKSLSPPLMFNPLTVRLEPQEEAGPLPRPLFWGYLVRGWHAVKIGVD